MVRRIPATISTPSMRRLVRPRLIRIAVNSVSAPSGRYTGHQKIIVFMTCGIERTNMTDTMWHASLVLAIYRNRHVAQARYFQLATVRSDGRPANRTVVFRGFLGGGHSIMVVADRRSGKAREIAADGRCEACWYFPMTREQFRLGGRVRVLGLDDDDVEAARACREVWRGLSDATRQSFTWPAPGAPRDPETSFGASALGPEVPAPDFLLLVLEPDEVDHLELDGNPQNRWAYRRGDDGGWTAVEINP